VVQKKLRMDARYANDDYLTAMMAHARAFGTQDLEAMAAAQRSLPVHPAQLYSAFTAFLLAGLLTAYYTLPHTAGRVFAMMLILEGSSRFLLELLRTEPSVLGPYFSLSMVIGLCMVALGVLLWYAFGRHARRVEPSPALALST
jgi:prolipoprotein diacylglyceryltransferase